MNLIKKAKLFCANLNFNESDFLRDLLSTVPLFTQDGNYFRWAHKSLQEYFAAQFIYLDSKDQQVKILRQFYNSSNPDKFINILDLYYDIDTKTFTNTIIYDLLNEYKIYYDSMFHGNLSIDETLIINRKEICFLYQPFVFTKSLNDDDNDTSYHTKINIMVKNLEKIGMKRISGRLDSIDGNKSLCCLVDCNVKESILFLVSRKVPKLFHFPGKEIFEYRVNISHFIKEDYEAHILEDDGDDVFNSRENFTDVNNLIQASKLRGIRINTSEAFNFLNEIQKQIDSENHEDFLLDGI